MYRRKPIIGRFSNIFLFVYRKESNASAVNNSLTAPHADVHLTLVPSADPTGAPTIVINSVADDKDLTVTPAFPNFPTDEEVVLGPDTGIFVESTNNTAEEKKNTIPLPASSPRSSQTTSSMLDELKYLLRPTSSLASPTVTTQASVRIHDHFHAHNYSCFFHRVARDRFSDKTSNSSIR